MVLSVVLHSDIDRPEVSVVICTRDRTLQLAHTLRSVIASCEASNQKCEVVVVDNAPSDGKTRELVASAPVRYVVEGRRGLGSARNTGVSEARSQVILFVDDDVEVSRNWVDDMSRPLRTESCDLIVSCVRPGEGRDLPWMGPLLRSAVCAFVETASETSTHVVGASFGFRRRVWERTGFDRLLGAGTDYGSGEDVLFGCEAARAGFVIHGCSTSPSTHNFDLSRLTRSELKRRARAIGRSDAYVRLKLDGRSTPRFLSLRVAREWVRLVLAVGRTFRLGVRMSDAEFRARWALARKRQLIAERRKATKA